MEIISSLQNPGIKAVVKLQQKASERKKQNLFVIEGRRELALAIKNKIKIKEVFLCEDYFHQDTNYPIDFKPAIPFKKVTPEVYNKISYRNHVEGIIALAEKHDLSLNKLELQNPTPLIIVLEAAEKPGNLGAILRTADAAGVDAVIVCDPKTDVFNPNVVRSSLGCVFSCPVALCHFEEYKKWSQQHKILSAVASLQTDELYYEKKLDIPLALVFGTESTGLSPHWYDMADIKLKIPMMGQIDSLNLSASVAILVYEAQRQRKWQKQRGTH